MGCRDTSFLLYRRRAQDRSTLPRVDRAWRALHIYNAVQALCFVSIRGTGGPHPGIDSIARNGTESTCRFP